MSLRRGPFAGLALLGALTAAGGSSAAPKNQLLFFPMILEAPDKVVSEIDKDTIPFSQPVRLAGAVKTRAPFEIAIEKGKRTMTVPAGAWFIKAIGEAGPVYCHAATERADSWWGMIYDVGVCLRDVQEDGVFDLQVVSDPITNRVRTPFEILLRRKDQWTPTSVAYEAVPEAAIPKARLELDWYYGRGILGQTSTAAMQVCWPEELVVPTTKSGERKLCGNVTWPGDRMWASDASPGKPLKAKLNEPEVVSWGPYRATVTRISDQRAHFVMDEQPAPGPVVTYLFARWSQGSNFSYQVSVFEFRKVDKVPTSALEILLGMNN